MNDIHDVLVWWGNSDDPTLSDIEYILSVRNSSSPTQPVKFITRDTHMSLPLDAGIQYNISVLAQRCGGDLTSNTSVELQLMFNGMI